MRVLRATNWTAPDRPQPVVICDGEMSDTLESVASSAVEKMNKEGAFVTYEIFDMPNGNRVSATWEAGRRTAEVSEQEKNQAMLYHWLAMYFDRAPDGRQPAPGATIAGDERMPLSVEEIRDVYEQLLRHPLYNDFTLSYIAKDGTVVKVRHGEIE